MRILIVEPFITGHHLEYLHHVFMMSFKMPETEFVFVLPESFIQAKSMFSWPENNKVLFDPSLPILDRNAKQSSLTSSLKKSINYSRLTKKYYRKYKPDYLFSIDIMTLVPFLPLYISKIKTVGIVYDIYLRKPRLSLRTKIVSMCRFLVLSKSSLFKKVFILNDGKSANELNQMYNTDKFEYLPDPYVPLQLLNNNFRKDNNISGDDIVFAHFGSLTKRKGTLDILYAIRDLNKEERTKYVFVFAGKVNDEIKNEFYNIVDSLNGEARIIVEDKFCSYEYLASLCSASNAILTPYRDTCKSSGLIGYASQFGVPVVAYEGGLLGELITKYKLGIFIPQGKTMLDAFKQVAKHRIATPPQDYCMENCVTNFIEAIRNAYVN